jgi:hypothetical protein
MAAAQRGPLIHIKRRVTSFWRLPIAMRSNSVGQPWLFDIGYRADS